MAKKKPTDLQLVLNNLLSQNKLTPLENQMLQIAANRQAKTAVEQKKKAFNPNEFANKKNVAQGLMDVALISLNASQLKTIFEYGSAGSGGSMFYYPLIVMLLVSLTLQILVGIMIVFISTGDINHENSSKPKSFPHIVWCSCGPMRHMSERQRITLLNNMVTIIVMVITFLNCMVAAFTPKLTDVFAKAHEQSTVTGPSTAGLGTASTTPSAVTEFLSRTGADPTPVLTVPPMPHMTGPLITRALNAT